MCQKRFHWVTWLFDSKTLSSKLIMFWGSGAWVEIKGMSLKLCKEKKKKDKERFFYIWIFILSKNKRSKSDLEMSCEEQQLPPDTGKR